MQRFDSAAAERLAAAFGVDKAKKHPKGVPIYAGDPAPDSPALGWVSSVATAADGIQVSVKWSSTKVSHGDQYRAFAPRWLCGRASGGMLEPAQFVSLALVNRFPDPNAVATNDESIHHESRSAARRDAMAAQRRGIRDYDEAFAYASRKNPSLFT